MRSGFNSTKALLHKAEKKEKRTKLDLRCVPLQTANKMGPVPHPVGENMHMKNYRN